MPVRHWNHPDAEQGIWDTFVLGGKRMPGVWRLRLKLPTGIHKRKGKGKRGAHLRDEGSEPRELDCKGVLNTPEDLLLADDLRDFICGLVPGDASNPLQIVHEAANYFRVGAVVIGNVDIDHPDPVDGWEWNLQLFEWQPDTQIKTVKDQDKKAKDDTAAWLPFRDDGVAGSGAPPSTDSVHSNLPNPRA